MSKKTKNQTDKEVSKEQEQKKVKEFIEEYTKLCEKHHIQLGAILDFQVGGIKPKVVPIGYEPEQKDTGLVK